MRINLVLPHQLPFPPSHGGGVENLIWLLGNEFAKRGHQIVAYSRSAASCNVSTRYDGLIAHVRTQGYDRHPNRWVDHINGLRYIRHVFRVLRPAEVTSCHTPFSFLLRKRAGIGVCTHTLHRTPKWPVPLYRKLDRVYCGSNAVVEQARAVDPGMRNLKRIYNCVDLKDPVGNRKAREGRGVRFLYVGRFVEDKGLESLIEGFEAVSREYPDNHLQTVGPQSDSAGADSRFYERMRRRVESGQCATRIRFRDAVFDKNELNRIIEAADVICVPSLSGETFSMAILEAMALAKAVLVSDFSPMPEAVDHEETGYVARAGDSASIADGMRFFSRRISEIEQIGHRGWEKARRLFTVERIAGEYLEDFEFLIGQRFRNAQNEVVCAR